VIVAAPRKAVRVDGIQQDVGLLITILRFASIISRPMRDGVADPAGLSPNELRLLLALGGEGESAGHELAELMGMNPMNVSRALGSLTAMGLVESVDDAANRRRKPHRLSVAGWARHKAMTPEIASVAAFLLQPLSATERRTLRRLIEKLDARIDDWTPPAKTRHVPRA
jgi:DNA-binding MarR family transcriptional regulator